ncbi:MAG TPA: ABC transporter ATP-binding protein [Actinomycetota bacterium]
MLVVEGIDSFYGRVQALRGVTLSVADGEMVALFGANGAGKTTTLRAISGMVSTRAGAISFEGRDLGGLTPERVAALGVAHIPEGRGVFSGMTVWQNLKMGGFVHRLPPDELDRRIDEVLALFPRLGERMGQAAGTMSGGEQQMLAIARALIGRPKLLMLDEPSHGLAPKVVQELFELLAKLRAGGTSLLIVEQYAAVALSVVDRGYVLERGRVVSEGAAARLRADWHELAGAYLGT